MLINGHWAKDFDPVQEPTMKADLFESNPNFATGSQLMVAPDLPVKEALSRNLTATTCMLR